MSATYLDKGKQPLFPVDSLFTPSASPPTSRPVSPQSRRKSTSRPPPPKRVRTSSTTSTAPSESNASNASSTSHKPTQALDPTRDEAWRESSQRLLNVWSQLADRYNVPLDKDDIIDLRSVKLVKDRGVTRRSKKMYIGYFGEASGDEGNDADERDEEDEIDIVPRPEPPVPIKLEMEKSNRVLPPFTEMNPDDADDLRSFLKEEERRRAIGGVDDEEDEVEIQYILAEGSDDDSVEDLPQDGDDGSDWVTDDAAEIPLKAIIGTSDRALTPVDSEDEFAKWDPEDATPKAPEPPPRELFIDIIDLTTPSPPSSPDLPLSRGRTSSPVKHGPRSPSSSFLRSKTRGARSPSAPPHTRVTVPVASRSKPTAPPDEIAGNIQLQTPPPSSSSNGTPEVPEANSPEPATPHSPSPPPPRRRPKTPGPSTETPRSRALQRRTPPRKPSSPRRRGFARPLTPPGLTAGTARDATPGPLTGRVPEIVITSRPRLSATPIRTHGESSRKSGGRQEPPLAVKPLPPKAVDKGKARAPVEDFDSSDDEPLPPPRRRAKSLAPPEHREIAFTERNVAPTRSSPIRAVQSSQPKGGTHASSARKRKRSTTPASCSSSDHESSIRATEKSLRAVTTPSLKPALRTAKSRDDTKQVDIESDTEPSLSATTKNRSRARSRPRTTRAAPHPPVPHSAPSFPNTWAMPATPHRSRSQSRPPPPMQYPQPIPPLQDPQMQYGFAQAIQYLSYIFASGAAPPSHPPLYPPQYGQNQSMAYPQTPKRHHRNSRREPSTSPEAGPSSSPRFGYNTPSHHAHPYPFTFDPAWSSATEPPMSSSPAVSPPSSPAPPAPSRSRARSKSRGSRVSFHLDPDDRPSMRSQGAVDEREKISRRAREEDDERLQNDERSSSRKGKTRQGRGRARENELSGEDDPPRPNVERGCTPGPSSQLGSARRK